MLSCGAPTSTVLTPSPLARMGPMVEPHAMSDLTQNSWLGTGPPRSLGLRDPTSRKSAADSASVA